MQPTAFSCFCLDAQRRDVAIDSRPAPATGCSPHDSSDHMQYSDLDAGTLYLSPNVSVYSVLFSHLSLFQIFAVDRVP